MYNVNDNILVSLRPQDLPERTYKMILQKLLIVLTIIPMKYQKLTLRKHKRKFKKTSG